MRHGQCPAEGSPDRQPHGHRILPKHFSTTITAESPSSKQVDESGCRAGQFITSMSNGGDEPGCHRRRPEVQPAPDMIAPDAIGTVITGRISRCRLNTRARRRAVAGRYESVRIASFAARSAGVRQGTGRRPRTIPSGDAGRCSALAIASAGDAWKCRRAVHTGAASAAFRRTR